MAKQIALMFSGGIDSTMAAVLLGKQYSKIHLLTYNNGYGHIFMKTTRKRVDELNSKIDSKYILHLSSTKDLFEKISVNNIVNEIKTHKSGFVWCMGCKLAMHTKSIIYCLENNINEVADGSSKSTQTMVEQKPFSIALIKSIYLRFNIDYKTPVYHISREDEINMLKKMKFNMGWFRILDRFIGIQPKCLAGEIYYMPNLVFGTKPHHENNEILSFFQRKSKIVEDYIKDYFNKQNIDIELLKSNLAK